MVVKKDDKRKIDTKGNGSNTTSTRTNTGSTGNALSKGVNRGSAQVRQSELGKKQNKQTTLINPSTIRNGIPTDNASEISRIKKQKDREQQYSTSFFGDALRYRDKLSDLLNGGMSDYDIDRQREAALYRAIQDDDYEYLSDLYGRMAETEKRGGDMSRYAYALRGTDASAQSLADYYSNPSAAAASDEWDTDLEYYRRHPEKLASEIESEQAANKMSWHDNYTMTGAYDNPTASYADAKSGYYNTERYNYLTQLQAALYSEKIAADRERQNMGLMGYDADGKAVVWSNDNGLNRNLASLQTMVDSGQYNSGAMAMADSAVAAAQQYYDEAMKRRGGANGAASFVYDDTDNAMADSFGKANDDVIAAKKVLERALYLQEQVYGTAPTQIYSGRNSDYNPTETDLYYRMVNGKFDMGAGDVISGNYSNSKAIDANDTISVMTDAERSTYNAIYNAYGIDKANDYLDKLYGKLQQRHGESAVTATYEQMQNSSNLESGILSAASTLLTPIKTATGLADVFKSLTGQRINTYDTAHMANRIQSAIRTGDSSKRSEVGQQLMGIINSSLDSAYNAFLFGSAVQGVGGALGAGEEALQEATGEIVSWAMGNQVVGDTIIELMDAGWDQDRAVAIGVARGAIEWATEKWSIEQILSDPNLINSFINEGAEEYVSGILNNVLDYVAANQDGVLMKYSMMIQSGYDKTTAFESVMGEIIADHALEFLAGGISGIGMGAVYEGIGAANKTMYESRAGQDIMRQFNGDVDAAREYQQGLIAEGLEMGAEGASQSQAFMDKQGKLTARQTYQQAAANEAKAAEIDSDTLKTAKVTKKTANGLEFTLPDGSTHSLDEYYSENTGMAAAQALSENVPGATMLALNGAAQSFEQYKQSGGDISAEQFAMYYGIAYQSAMDGRNVNLDKIANGDSKLQRVLSAAVYDGKAVYEAKQATQSMPVSASNDLASYSWQNATQYKQFYQLGYDGYTFNEATQQVKITDKMTAEMQSAWNIGHREGAKYEAQFKQSESSSQGSQRNDSMGSGRQGGEVSVSTGSQESGPVITKREASNGAVITAGTRLTLDAVGVTTATSKVFSVDSIEDNDYGGKTVVVNERISINGKNGVTFVDALCTKEGNIVLWAKDPRRWENRLHEEQHARMRDWTAEQISEEFKSIFGGMPSDERISLLEQYASMYDELYGDGMTLQSIMEEMICDAYGGITRDVKTTASGRMALDRAINRFNEGRDEQTQFKASAAQEDAEYLELAKDPEKNADALKEFVRQYAANKGWSIAAFHGTARADRVGTVFRPDRATSGPMAFFTDNRSIAENYARDKQDTSLAYDTDYDSYETQFRAFNAPGRGHVDMPVHKAWGYIPFETRSEIKKKAGQLREDWDEGEGYLFDESNSEANGGFQWQLKEARGNVIRALEEQWLNSGTLFNNESEFLKILELTGVTDALSKVGINLTYKDPYYREPKVYDVFLSIKKPFDVTKKVNNRFVENYLKWAASHDNPRWHMESADADLWDKNNIDADIFADRMRRNIADGNTNAWTSIPDSMTDYLKHLRYDGIKDAGGKNGGDLHTVWIPFSSEQVKSAEPVTYDNNGNIIPLSERFNAGDYDIRYSASDVPTGTFFSGVGTVESALDGLIADVFAAEYDPGIRAVYKDNHGAFVFDDVRTALVEKYKGKIQYFHASPVCKNYSAANNNRGEQPINIETARATARALETLTPRAFTLENVPGYQNSEALKLIIDTLDKLGYKWDADVYNAADYGAATSRDRYILRAVREGELPPKPRKTNGPGNRVTWGDVAGDLIDGLPEAKTINPRMIESLKELSGIDVSKIDRPLLVFGESYKNKQFGHAFIDETVPTIIANSGASRVFMPDGRVLEATPRLLARIMGLSDSVNLPNSTVRARTVIGNGIPAQLTHAVMGSVVNQLKAENEYRISQGESIKYSAPTFYSKMEREITALKDGKYGSGAVVSMLRGKGVKAEEIKWSGIETFLQGKKSVSKQDLMEFAAGSQLKITEHYLDDRKLSPTAEELRDMLSYQKKFDDAVKRLEKNWSDVAPGAPVPNFKLGNASHVISQAVEKYNKAISHNVLGADTELRLLNAKNRATDILTDYDYFGFDSATEALTEIRRQFNAFDYSGMTESEVSALREYVDLVKEANKRKKNAGTIGYMAELSLQSYASVIDELYRKSKDNSKLREREQRYKTQWGKYSYFSGDNYTEILFSMPDSNYTNESMDVHWGDTIAGGSGVLAHARIQTVDTENSGRMLFVEEIQSDWHNAGSKNGYYTSEQVTEGYASQQSQKYYSSVFIPEMEKAGIVDAIDEVGRNPWIVLANAYESSSVEEMDNSLREIGLSDEHIYAITEAVNNKPKFGSIVSNDSAPDAPLKNYHEYVMKRLIRIAAEQGLDSIGWTTADIQSKRWSAEYAEGYRIEYDQDIPSFMRKYVKQWGAKVELKSVMDGKYSDPVYVVELTDSMKNSVLDEGQTLYSASDEYIPESSAEYEQRLREADENSQLSREEYFRYLKSKEAGWKEHAQWQEEQYLKDRDTILMQNRTQGMELRRQFYTGEYKTPSSSDIKSIAEGLAKKYIIGDRADIGIDDIRFMLQDVLNAQKQGQSANDRYFAAQEEAEKVASEIIDANDASTEVIESVKLIKDMLRGNRIVMPTGFTSEEKKALRAKAMHIGFFIVNYDGSTAKKSGMLSVDTIYERLNAENGGLFPDNIIGPNDMLEHILDVYDSLEAASVNPFTGERAELTRMIAGDIMQQLYNSAVVSPDAYAMSQQHEDMVQSYYRQRMIETQRRTDDYVQKIKDRYAERWSKRVENQKERQAERKDRADLLKIAKKMDRLHTTPDYMKAIDDIVGELDLISQRCTGKITIGDQIGGVDVPDSVGIIEVRPDGKRIVDISQLKAWVDNEIGHNPDFNPSKDIIDKIDRVNKKHIADLDIGEVRDILHALQHIENEIAEGKKLIDEQDRRDVAIMAHEIKENIRGSAGIADGIIPKVMRTIAIDPVLTPTRFFRRVTGYTDADPLYRGCLSLQQGEMDMQDYERRAREGFKQFTSDRKFMASLSGKDSRPIKFTARTNKGMREVTITPDMLISMYQHSLNKDNLRHIKYGGFEIPEYTALMKGDTETASRKSLLVKMEASEIISLCNKYLTAKEKSYALAQQRYYNQFAPSHINPVSTKLIGYEIATVKNYFPIESSRRYLGTQLDAVKGDASIEGQKNLKSRINGTNPIMLRSSSEVLDRAIGLNSKYVGLAIPVRNMSKLYGAKSWHIAATEEQQEAIDNAKKDDSGAGVDYDADSVQGALAEMWGNQATSYVEHLMTDLQTGTRKWGDEGLSAILSKIGSNYASATLMNNLSVTIKQTASYPTAAAVVGWDALGKALRDTNKVDIELIAKYTPLLWYRSKGFADNDLTFTQYSKGEGKMKIDTQMIQKADILTTTKLWKAAEYYVKAHPAEFAGRDMAHNEKVAEVYNRIILNTQPNYSTMERGALLRSDNQLLKNLSMFKTQPFQNFNILFDSIANVKAKEQQLKAAQAIKAETEIEKADAAAKIKTAQQALEQAKQNQANSISSILVSQVVFTSMQVLWNLFRGKMNRYKDDDDEMTVLSFGKRFLLDMAESGFGMIPFGSDIFQIIETQITGEKYYGLDAMTPSAISSALEALQTSGKVLEEFGAAITGTGNWRDAFIDGLDSAEAVAAIAGIPVANISNFLLACTRSTLTLATKAGIISKETANYNYGLLTEKTTANNIKAETADAIWADYRDGKNWQTKFDRYVKQASKNDSDFKKGDKTAEEARESAESAMRTKLEKSIRDGYVSGEISESEAVRALQDLCGYNTTASAENRLDDWTMERETGIKYSKLKESYLNGDIARDEAVEYKMEYGGKTRKDAEAEVLKYDMAVDTGYEYDDMKELFSDGEISASEAIKYLKKYGGLSDEAAQKKVTSWKCYIDTGIEYSELKDEFLDGNVTGSRAANMMTRYGGLSNEEAQSRLTNWQCEKDTGIAYDDIGNALKGGEINESQASQYLQTYGGKSKEDADKTAMKWRYQAESGNSSAGAVEANYYYGTVRKVTKLTAEQWDKVYKDLGSIEGTDKDNDGKTDAYSKMDAIIAYIDSLNISPDAKDEILKMYYTSKAAMKRRPWR